MNPKMRYACNYAVLRFLPYPETDEFVNLGVVMHCPALGILEFRIEKKKHARVTDFFPELNREHYRAARDAIAGELLRVQAMAKHGKNPELGKRAFLELVRPRESVFRFGEIRTVLTGRPNELVDELFDRFVERHFAKPKEYQENIMAKRFLDVLREDFPQKDFRRDVILGTAEYHVRIPICSEERTSNRVARHAIKPLDLDRDEPTAIIDHGDAWIQRIRRLKEVGRMPDQFIVAARFPTKADCKPAAETIFKGLEGEGVTLVDDNPRNLVRAISAN